MKLSTTALTVGAAVVLAGAAAVLAGVGRSDFPPRNCPIIEEPVRIRPDYTDTVIPPNVAPLNFVVEGEPAACAVRITASGREPLEATARGAAVRIPLRPWRRMLTEAAGGSLEVEVFARDADGAWRRYRPFELTVASESIDPYLVCRRMNVLYEFSARMQITQRCVEDFREDTILDSRSFGYGCMNCHTFLANRTDRMVIQMRSRAGGESYGRGMLLFQDGQVSKVTCHNSCNPGVPSFTSWHPSGRAIAFSMNTPMQFFHSARKAARDGLDDTSDLAVYRLDLGTVVGTPDLARSDRLETWPAWEPEGKYLYFCTADAWDVTNRDGCFLERCQSVRYDLARVSYDLDTGEWGGIETVLAAADTGMSASQPRFSPDGRFLVLTLAGYSTFAMFQPSSDLYLLDRATGELRRMECNSERAESWHSWSSNGRWLAFSSKRNDGLFLRAYFTYVAGDGHAHKPFVLPQADPTLDDRDIRIRQTPELIAEPIPVMGEGIARVIRTDPWDGGRLPITGASPATEPADTDNSSTTAALRQ